MSQAAYGTEDGGHGLWLLDTNTGARREITPFGYWPFIAAGAAWGPTGDDTVAPPPAGWGAANSVARLDLQTGQSQQWLSVGGRRVDIAGLDNEGRLLVLVSNGSGSSGSATVAELRLISSPGQWRTYAVPPATSSSAPADPVFTGVTDASGIWLTEINAIYHFDAQHGLRLMEWGGYFLNVVGHCA